jgi:hypothetical protein
VAGALMAAIDITTYEGLQAAVADYLNRQDLTDQIPAFVTLAEASFNRELRVRDMMVRANTTSDAENICLPDDFLEAYSLALTPGTTPQAALRYMSEKESNAIKASGMPPPVIGYTVIDGMFELVPAPGGDVELRLVYYARIPSLGELTTTNWLLRKSPDLYLYSTLLQTAPYINDAQRLQTWASIRASLMEAMHMESEGAMRPGSGLHAMARAF